jgi:hypothetical protein
VAQLVFDIETTTLPSSAPSQPNSVREYAGTAPGWSVPGREPDEVVRDAIHALAGASSQAVRDLAAKLAEGRGFTPDHPFPLNTDVTVPAWALFVGQARAITAALSNTPDPMAARREEHRRREVDVGVLTGHYIRQATGYQRLMADAVFDPPRHLDPVPGLLARLARSLGMSS